MSKKPAKKRRPCATAWFPVDSRGRVNIYSGEWTRRAVDGRISNQGGPAWLRVEDPPLVAAQFRLVPVKPKRKAKP